MIQIQLNLSRINSILIFLVGLGVLIGLTWLSLARFHKLSSGTIQTDQLSVRAEEFVATQRKQNNSEWRQRQLTKTTQTTKSDQLQFVTTCFSLILPYQVRSSKTSTEADGCHFSAQVISPAARLVVWARPLVGNFQDDSGILMRRKESAIYQEFSFNSPKFDQVIMFVAKDQLIIFGLKNQTLVSYAFSETQTDQISDVDLNLILNSTIIVPGQSHVTPALK